MLKSAITCLVLSVSIINLTTFKITMFLASLIFSSINFNILKIFSKLSRANIIMVENNILIVDNGAYQIKAGFSTEPDPGTFPNAIIKSKNDKRRSYVADEFSNIIDHTSLYYTLPCERGYIVNWDAQLQIWNRIFGDCLLVDYKNSGLVLTEPSSIAKAFVDNKINEIIFENYQFDRFLKTSAPSLVAHAHIDDQQSDCSIVVDSGYSFTHIIPFIKGKIARNGIIRIDVGGKALTNQLKEWISYRQLNVIEETHIINCCKEDVCFVSRNFKQDMKNFQSAKAKRLDYVLPDFHNVHRGFVLRDKSNLHDDPQILRLGTERFAIPEILFHPSDIGIDQMGIVEAIFESASRFNNEIQRCLLKNIILIGGNSLFPNYKERIQNDLRSLVDESVDIHVYLPNDPIKYPWECGKHILSSGSVDTDFSSKFVARSEYNECGSNICFERFSDFCAY